MRNYHSIHSGSFIYLSIMNVFSFLSRIDIPEPEADTRTSDFFIPNGYYSDLILLIWGLVSLFWVWQGMWKTVFVSFLVIVSILKVVDLVGRKFGYNILRTNQEMSFYPIRLLITQNKRNSITFRFQHTDSNSFKLHTSKGIFI